MHKLYIKHPGKNRFQCVEQFVLFSEGIDYVVKSRPENCTSHWQLRHGSTIMQEWKPCRNPKAVEMPVGKNLEVLKYKVDCCHIAESYTAVCRRIVSEMRNWSIVPKPLRRGVIKAIVSRHCANRVMYYDVMGGKRS